MASTNEKMLKNLAESESPEFKSQFCDLLTLWPWTSHQGLYTCIFIFHASLIGLQWRLCNLSNVNFSPLPASPMVSSPIPVAFWNLDFLKSQIGNIWGFVFITQPHCQLPSSAIVEWKQPQTRINKWVWWHSNKTLLIKLAAFGFGQGMSFASSWSRL